MVRGFRASCGKTLHGKEAAAAGELRRCFACDRPGSRDGCSISWQHVGDSETWAGQGEWSASVGSAWRHDRDLQQGTLSRWESASVPGSTAWLACTRGRRERSFAQNGGWTAVADGPVSFDGISGVSSSGTRGAGRQGTRLLWRRPRHSLHGLEFTRSPCCNKQRWSQTPTWTPPQTLLSRRTSRKRCVRTVVTSPPYKRAFAILKQAMRVGRMGVAFKLRLTFLEPTKTRGRWLMENSPDRIVMLSRATYRGRGCSSTEAWFMWETGRGGEEGRKPAICFSLRDGAL